MSLLWLQLGVIAVNLALLAWSIVASIRLHRRLRHAMMLDQLLAVLVLRAFTNAHMPIWRAWAVMGAIEIDIKQHRNFPGPDA